MTEYWIIIDGRQQGPFSRDQITDMNLTPDTPVWRQGLLDWTTLGALADFADPSEATPPPVPDPHPWAAPQPQPAPKAPYTGPMQAREPVSGAELGPAPTYLAWSIVVTLLCCMVLGIVAIIYAAKVSSANERGDYERAWRLSRTTELWLITAFTLGLVTAPFAMALQMGSL